MAEQMESDFSRFTFSAVSALRHAIGAATIELEFVGAHAAAAAGHFLVDDEDHGSVNTKEAIGQVDYGVDEGQGYLTQQWR